MSKNAHKIAELHHGDCVGADANIHDLARELMPGAKLRIHPPSNNQHRAYKAGDDCYPEKKYADRNLDIVRCSDIIVAFPPCVEVQRGSGTWLTVRIARREKTPHIIVMPDGDVRVVNYQ